jgi:myo-inositol 2-dehydrogenase/D-chiro-inositol 1-dehydrogenase
MSVGFNREIAMEQIRVGLVGLAQGYYATLYSRICAHMRDVEFIGICDLGITEEYARACAEISPAEFAAELGVPLVHDLAKLLDRGPHALIVTSETVDHHRHAVHAMEANVHVFIGKPMTTTLAAAEEIVSVAERQPSLVVLPGQPARYEDGMSQARDRLQSGHIGHPLMAHLFVNHPAMTNHAWEMSAERSGSPLIEFGSYPVDLAEWIVGSPIKTVYAQADNYQTPQIEGPDNIKMLCRHSNGTISSLDVYSSISWNYPFLGLEIIGEHGCIRADYHNYPVYVHRADSVQVSSPRYSLMNQREIEHFMDCVRGKATPIITPQEYVSTIRVLEAARKSIDQGQPVEILRSKP